MIGGLVRRGEALVFGGLLIAALGLTGLLTYRSLVAEQRHRVVAERAVGEYSTLIAEEIVRRTVFEYEYFGFTPLRAELLFHIRKGKIPEVTDFQRSSFPRVREAAPLVEQAFLADFGAGTIEPPLPGPLQEWALSHLEADVLGRRKESQPRVTRVVLDGREQWIVFVEALLPERRVPGFVVSEEGLRILAARAFKRRSPFPVSFGGQLTDGDLFFSLSRDGRNLYRTAGKFDPVLGSVYIVPPKLHLVLGGSEVRASISKRAAQRLIPGGIPAARPVGSLVMMLATVCVLGAMVMVLRREKKFDRVRSDFVAGVSHELRTPLTQIRMFAEMLLLDRVRTEGEKQRALEVIRRETVRLSNLVENVLAFSRGERGALGIVRVEHDVTQLVRESLSSFSSLAAAKEVIFRMDAAEACIAPVDEDAVRQIVLNLLDNAVKYGPARQTVDVSVSCLGDRISIAVKDEGPGIPRLERDRIWTRFYRIDRDLETHHTGSGIGLSVVRELVEKHQGECRVEESRTGGAKFVVELPST